MFTESKLPENIKSERPPMTLRSNNIVKFKEKFTRKTIILNSPVYQGYALWNELPEDIQNLKSLSTFKKQDKVHILHPLNVKRSSYCKDIT